MASLFPWLSHISRHKQLKGSEWLPLCISWQGLDFSFHLKFSRNNQVGNGNILGLSASWEVTGKDWETLQKGLLLCPLGSWSHNHLPPLHELWVSKSLFNISLKWPTSPCPAYSVTAQGSFSCPWRHWIHQEERGKPYEISGQGKAEKEYWIGLGWRGGGGGVSQWHVFTEKWETKFNIPRKYSFHVKTFFTSLSLKKEHSICDHNACRY